MRMTVLMLVLALAISVSPSSCTSSSSSSSSLPALSSSCCATCVTGAPHLHSAQLVSSNLDVSHQSQNVVLQLNITSNAPQLQLVAAFVTADDSVVFTLKSVVSPSLNSASWSTEYSRSFASAPMFQEQPVNQYHLQWIFIVDNVGYTTNVSYPGVVLNVNRSIDYEPPQLVHFAISDSHGINPVFNLSSAAGAAAPPTSPLPILYRSFRLHITDNAAGFAYGVIFVYSARSAEGFFILLEAIDAFVGDGDLTSASSSSPSSSVSLNGYTNSTYEVHIPLYLGTTTSGTFDAVLVELFDRTSGDVLPPLYPTVSPYPSTVASSSPVRTSSTLAALSTAIGECMKLAPRRVLQPELYFNYQFLQNKWAFNFTVVGTLPDSSSLLPPASSSLFSLSSSSSLAGHSLFYHGQFFDLAAKHLLKTSLLRSLSFPPSTAVAASPSSSFSSSSSSSSLGVVAPTLLDIRIGVNGNDRGGGVVDTSTADQIVTITFILPPYADVSLILIYGGPSFLSLNLTIPASTSPYEFLLMEDPIAVLESPTIQTHTATYFTLNVSVPQGTPSSVWRLGSRTSFINASNSTVVPLPAVFIFTRTQQPRMYTTSQLRTSWDTQFSIVCTDNNDEDNSSGKSVGAIIGYCVVAVAAVAVVAIVLYKVYRWWGSRQSSDSTTSRYAQLGDQLGVNA